MADGTDKIELDCAPIGPRPSSLLIKLIDGTGQELDPDDPDAAFFGNWTWIIPLAQHDQYEKVRDVIKERIT